MNNVKHLNVISQLLMNTFNLLTDQLNTKDDQLLPHAPSGGVNP